MTRINSIWDKSIQVDSWKCFDSGNYVQDFFVWILFDVNCGIVQISAACYRTCVFCGTASRRTTKGDETYCVFFYYIYFLIIDHNLWIFSLYYFLGRIFDQRRWVLHLRFSGSIAQRHSWFPMIGELIIEAVMYGRNVNFPWLGNCLSGLLLYVVLEIWYWRFREAAREFCGSCGVKFYQQKESPKDWRDQHRDKRATGKLHRGGGGM